VLLGASGAQAVRAGRAEEAQVVADAGGAVRKRRGGAGVDGLVADHLLAGVRIHPAVVGRSPYAGARLAGVVRRAELTVVAAHAVVVGHHDAGSDGAGMHALVADRLVALRRLNRRAVGAAGARRSPPRAAASHGVAARAGRR